MSFFLFSLGILFFSGIAPTLIKAHEKFTRWFWICGTVVGCGLGFIPAISVLLNHRVLAFQRAWAVPYGCFFLRMDGLSAFFLLPLLIMGFLASVYGGKYLSVYEDKRSLKGCYFFYNLLLVSMAFVVTAYNGILFLIAWEIMSLSSFFLVTFEYEKEEVRRAGWIYLIFTHVGAACLIAFFVSMGQRTGSFNFDHFQPSSLLLSVPTANILFLLALIGFGSKAGLVPFHVWLPEAHPAAPSHVSAVMSGVMIKMGVYGLLRALIFLGEPRPGWGITLVGLGLVSGLFGVLFALGQHDFKRLLAYHSIENVGIIIMGIGLGVLGLANHQPMLIILGFGGGLFHVANHAFFKGLLFLGAGAVSQATGTKEIDQLGGLRRKMPYTSGMFLLGSVALVGLPPLNGFISEFLIYGGAFTCIREGGRETWLPAISIVAGLALIGGLAIVCFTKVFGILFLGEARTQHADQARDPGWDMLLPMMVLGMICLGLGLASPYAIDWLMVSPLQAMTGLSFDLVHHDMAPIQSFLGNITLTIAFFFFMGAILSFLRWRLFANKSVRRGVSTWGCGYDRPSPRMQYTSSSFTQPVVDFFSLALRPLKQLEISTEPFPQQGVFHSQIPDLVQEWLYTPWIRLAKRLSFLFRWIQAGRLQFYILYIALTLLFLLIWSFGL